jgi:hypothetical protein
VETKPTAKELRAKKYDSEFIECKKHPGRRASRSAYVTDRVAYCRTCRGTRADGTKKKHDRMKDVVISVKNRAKYGAGTQSMSVLSIAERIIGTQI